MDSTTRLHCFIRSEDDIVSIRCCQKLDLYILTSSDSSGSYHLKSRQKNSVRRYAYGKHESGFWETAATWDNGTKIAFIKSMMAVIENVGVTLYKMDGEKLRHVSCKRPGGSNSLVSITECDSDSVIILGKDPWTIFKLNVTTESVEWTYKHSAASRTPVDIHCNGNFIFMLTGQDPYKKANSGILIIDQKNGEVKIMLLN